VMPYPGTGAYEWAEKEGFLAAESFDDWLNPDGGHRCVLNLPGLSPKDLEEFCEYAVRKFHLRPRYIVRKAFQAIVQPQGGIRSVNAFVNFLRSVVTSRKAVQVPVEPKFGTIQEGWHSRTRVPNGRMEALSKTSA
jgi:anaerobic magnesium-protoporphyrin IX monomethyl ester cyclase